MSKTNIIFNNKDYSVDDSFLSTHSNDLKQHLSTVMSGTGATIKLGGVVYNVDAAKLAAAKSAFVAHLGSISGGGEGSMPEKNEYGFYYNEKYILTYSKYSSQLPTGQYMILHEDGLVTGDDYFFNNNHYFYIEDGVIKDLMGVDSWLITKVLEDGKIIQTVGDDGVLYEEWQLESTLGGGGGNDDPEPSGFPIAWNSMEVVDNAVGSTSSGFPLFVKVSDFIPSIEEIQNTSFTNPENTLLVQEITELGVGCWKIMYGGYPAVLVTVAGEYDGIKFNEAGFYFENTGVTEEWNEDYVIDIASDDELTYGYAANFADNSWDDIALACQNNEVPETWAVGDAKTMMIGENEVEITIIGKNHDEYADGGVAPLTFMTKNIGEKRDMNSTPTNAGGWDGSEMYAYLNSDLLNNIEYKDSIKAVKKITNIGGSDAGGTATTTKTTNDKLFFLSYVEIESYYKSVPNAFAQEGKTYAIFADNESRQKHLSGFTSDWWLRSPYHNASGYFGVSMNLQGIGSDYANSSHGVSFAFCF